MLSSLPSLTLIPRHHTYRVAATSTMETNRDRIQACPSTWNLRRTHTYTGPTRRDAENRTRKRPDCCVDTSLDLRKRVARRCPRRGTVEMDTASTGALARSSSSLEPSTCDRG